VNFGNIYFELYKWDSFVRILSEAFDIMMMEEYLREPDAAFRQRRARRQNGFPL
jgi:hypothetical protein